MLLDGHSSVVLPTGDVAVTPGTVGSRQVRITFEIENPTGSAVTPVCIVTVVYSGRDILGPGQASLASLPAHAREQRVAEARTTSQLPDGSGAKVACET